MIFPAAIIALPATDLLPSPYIGNRPILSPFGLRNLVERLSFAVVAISRGLRMAHPITFANLDRSLVGVQWIGLCFYQLNSLNAQFSRTMTR